MQKKNQQLTPSFKPFGAVIAAWNLKMAKIILATVKVEIPDEIP